MKRRNFVKTCAFTSLGMPLIQSLSSCGSSSEFYAGSTKNGNKLVLDKSIFTYSENNVQKTRPYVFVNAPGETYPICLYKVDEENYLATLMSCTHQGCQTIVQKETVICPCHGSRFSVNGKCTKGPAKTNLKTFAVSSNKTQIFIQLP
ncbi:MAG: Rieske (2Fe-2S) protein [Lentisphaeraceae bacterium]|nr:Rieske (2Fe-2S) protein [Lentisphaeraceae bacterium]